jgi:hypothetical protein
MCQPVKRGGIRGARASFARFRHAIKDLSAKLHRRMTNVERQFKTTAIRGFTLPVTNCPSHCITSDRTGVAKRITASSTNHRKRRSIRTAYLCSRTEVHRSAQMRRAIDARLTPNVNASAASRPRSPRCPPVRPASETAASAAAPPVPARRRLRRTAPSCRHPDAGRPKTSAGPA